MKPPPAVMPSNNPATIEEIVEVADQIRDEQNALSPSERLWIGGDLVFTVLVQGTIQVSTMHRFAYFDAQWLAMNRLSDRGQRQGSGALAERVKSARGGPYVVRAALDVASGKEASPRNLRRLVEAPKLLGKC
jgi:hypothetical protein